MNIPLTPELEELVQKKVASGLYDSAGDVIGEALRLLEERDDLAPEQMDAWRHEIAIGLDQARRGDLHDGEAFFEGLEAQSAHKSGDSP